MDNRAKLLDFLKSQRFLVIGTQGDDLWIVNVFHSTDNDFNIYFVSDEEEKHSLDILQNPDVVFSTVWFNQNDYTDRKGVQGKGVCRVVESNKDIEKGIKKSGKRKAVRTRR